MLLRGLRMVIRANQLSNVRNSSSFQHKQLTITPSQILKNKTKESELLFGHTFTDHMLTVDWSVDNGWRSPQIVPFDQLSIHPASSALHYAVELFEGLKAFHSEYGSILMFRPDENMARMNRSADATCLPSFDGLELTKCISELIKLDRDWVPKARGTSLYVRPTMIGTDPNLGVQPPKHAKLYVILSPVGPYFATGFNPVTLFASPEYVRAYEGGSGNAKIGANYGPTLRVQKIAEAAGCQQVMWLYGKDQNITEVGSMNMAMLIENEAGVRELITPPLNGIILAGVVRKSVLELVRNYDNIRLSEREMTISEFLELNDRGKMLEVFGMGTACSICPVSKVVYNNVDHNIPTMANGAQFSNRLMKNLFDIQYGVIKNHPWQYKVC